jgi:hypothetical protein
VSVSCEYHEVIYEDLLVTWLFQSQTPEKLVWAAAFGGKLLLEGDAQANNYYQRLFAPCLRPKLSFERNGVFPRWNTLFPRFPAARSFPHFYR